MYWSTKSGQVISTDDSVQMKTSSDMMTEDWYQKAIHQGAKPVLTPAHKSDSQLGLFLSLRNLLMQRELIWAFFAWIFPMKLWKPISINFSWVSRVLPLSSMKSMNLFYHPQHTVYSSSSEMEAMKPYIETGQGYTPDYKSYVSQEKIAGTDWTVLGVSSLEKLDQVRSQLMWTLLGASVTSLLACLCLVWLSLKRWIAPLNDLRETMLEY